MSIRPTKMFAVVLAAAVVGVGLFLLGRVTVDTHAERSGDFAAGRSAGYSDGLQAGEAQGRQEGRALQEGTELPATSQQPVQDAFNAGYTAGVNDAFGGYDGGWALSMPYVIVLEPGTGKIVYRFSSRTPFEPNINYYLCADGKSLCQQPRN